MHRRFDGGGDLLSLGVVHDDWPLPATHQEDSDTEQNNSLSGCRPLSHRRTIDGLRRGEQAHSGVPPMR
jgi:hypothetical protein